MPCLNRIAAESTVFDQHFGEDFSRAPEGHAWWSGCYHFPRKEAAHFLPMASLPEFLNQGNIAAQFFAETATPEIVPLPAAANIRVLDSFGDLIRRGSEWLADSQSSPETPRLLWLKALGKTFDGFSLGEWDSEDNDAALSHLDKTIEPLCNQVLDLARSRKVLFILTSARGQSLGERAAPFPLETTWAEEFVHLPLIVHHSEATGGERRLELTQPMDLPATLLDFFALEPPPQSEGQSLLPSILGRRERERHFLTAGCFRVWEAIRTQDFHFVRLSDPHHPDGHRRLLFLKLSDVWDWQDVSAQNAETTDALSRQLDAFLTATRNQVPVDFTLFELAKEVGQTEGGPT